MAKYGVTNVAGGGGIGSDELSVTKDYVLNGKTYVGTDTNDEIGTGTMANNGTTANQSLNAGGSFQVKKGYHAQDFSVNANSLASQTSATATSGHILSGQSAWVNGAKVNGSIPWQNADVSGTDRVRATNMSNWAGTINLGVRNGHYLNGVNWIQQDIPNFQAGNIKKGVNIGGIVGTFEGYVPTPTDLYLRGNNIAGFTFGYSSNKPTFESGGIRMNKSNLHLVTTQAINFNAYNYINAELYYESLDLKAQTSNLTIGMVIYDPAGQVVARANSSNLSNNVYRTVSINLANVSLTTAPKISLNAEGQYWYDGNDGEYWQNLTNGRWTGWVYRVWLS